MNVVHATSEAAVTDVLAALPDTPSYSAAYVSLYILEEKCFLKHREHGPRHVFAPFVSPERVRGASLKCVMEAFFDGSLANSVVALVDTEKLSP